MKIEKQLNWGFGADNNARSPQQRHRGSTGKQPTIPNCIHVHTCLIIGITLISLFSGCTSYSQKDWKRSAPEVQNVNATMLAELNTHIKSNLPHLRSLLIARNGVLVYEEYYNGASVNELQNIQSMTKSILSALIGIAMDRGYITDLDQKVLNYFPEYQKEIKDSLFYDITLKHLITMSSGIEDAAPMTKLITKSILSQILLFEPGSKFQYSSPGSHVISDLLQRAIGMPLMDFTEKELLGPLDIQKIIWYKTDEGIPSGGYSSLWRSRDILKFGQLYLNQGVWKEKQIIPSRYINESIKTHIAGDFYDAHVEYGYLWWTNLFAKGYAALGYGDQYLLVIPELELVVLCTSDSQQPKFMEHIKLVEDYIIPAVGIHVK